MSRHHYTYSTQAAAPRHVTGHGTSSAFSSSANPDEDWTKISDLAERRRIQNRIAQRNYRKKLKRRLEDLERRAGSSSASPPQTHAEIHQQARNEQPTKQYTRSPEIVQQQSPPRFSHNQYTPPMEENLIYTFERATSRSPPLFAYHQYPAPEEIVYPPYPQSQPYRAVSTGADQYGEFLAPVPVTLPSMMHFSDAIKREEDTMPPYNMSYQCLPAIEGGHGYDEPLTPPLSHSYQNSENGYHYPSTPLSMPPSPRITSQV